MKIIDDGIIKFNTLFTQALPLKESEYIAIEQPRKILHYTKLIGAYLTNNIGYGNISIRKNYQKIYPTNKIQFLITGTQTGNLPNLNGDHYTRVIDYNIDKFEIHSHGPINASSESLTHASIYEADIKISAIIHIHNLAIWKGMIKDKYPATPANIPYGSKQMAKACKQCINRSSKNYFVMKGHNEGVIIYGKTINEAIIHTISLYNNYVDSNFKISSSFSY